MTREDLEMGNEIVKDIERYNRIAENIKSNDEIWIKIFNLGIQEYRLRGRLKNEIADVLLREVARLENELAEL